VVFIADDGSLDIVVKAQTLSDIEATQIADIASRQANTEISNVYVRPTF
jgi:stage III sporulation protein AH